MKKIKCQKCGKEIEKRGNRKYCTSCRIMMDKVLADKYVARYHENKEKC